MTLFMYSKGNYGGLCRGTYFSLNYGKSDSLRLDCSVVVSCFSCQKLRTIGEKKTHFDERVLWGGSTTQKFYLFLMGREVILLQVLSSFLSWNKKQLYDSIHYHGVRFSPLYQSPARDQIGLEYWMWFTVQAKVLYKMIACCMILHWTWKIMIKQFRTSKQQ